MEVLLVDADPDQLDTLALTLTLHWPDARVWRAATAAEAQRLHDLYVPDLVILDLALPDADGNELTRRLRAVSESPILILSARAAEKDCVFGLEAGADDYVRKPVGTLELLARIKALLRRARVPIPSSTRPPFMSGELRVDFASREVHRDGAPVHLSPIEYRLLYHLVHNAQRILTHEMLLERVWGGVYGGDADSEHLRVHVRHLRQKLGDDPAHPRYIATERGIGYRFVGPTGHARATGTSGPSGLTSPPPAAR